MIRFNRMMAVVLALLLTLSLCACGAEEAPETQAPETTAATEAPVVEQTQAAEDGKVTYTIHVEDENGAPLAGVMVQICKDACLPGMTDAEGNAVFTVAEDSYKASFLSLPAGYDYATEETEFYFEAGSYEITLTLKAA